MRKFRGAGRKPAAPSRSTTSSSIRGKISAPIPITAGDEEFPIRASRNAIPTPPLLESLGSEPRAAPIPSHGVITQHEDGDGSAPGEDSTRAPLSRTPSFAPSHESPMLHTRHVSSVRRSGGSNPSRSSAEKPLRKKSTLRSVLGRLFGRKRKSGSSANGIPEVSTRAGQHRSDPTALRKHNGRGQAPQRSASMPINEFNRALRSHSPFGADSPSDEVEKILELDELDGRSRPRAWNTPSRLYEPLRTPGFANWTGLSPRPASSHARGSGIFDDSQGPIGFAVTSGSNPNRRSRSMGYLRDAAMEHEVRRRSDEIRYLRESYRSFDQDALSPISSQHKPGADSHRITLENDLSPQTERREAPQPFNFGPLGEMAGMKITQAASLETRVSTLEARLLKMEKLIAHLHDRNWGSNPQLGDSLKSQYTYGSFVTRPMTDSSDQSLPRYPPSRMYQQTHNPQADTAYSVQNNTSHEFSRPSTTSTQPSYTHSYEELSPRPTTTPHISSPAEARPQTLQLNNYNISTLHSDSLIRPLSTSTTIRAIASSSPVSTPNRSLSLSKPGSGSLTAHHYSALLNLIEAEQSARAALETQVGMLQRQVQELLSQGKPYPPPEAPLPPVPDRKTMGGVAVSAFAGFGDRERSEGEDEDDGEEEDQEEGDDDEIYATPREERGHYGMGLDDLSPDRDFEGRGESGGGGGGGGGRFADARTMSLSQLTMGRGAVVAGGGF